MKLVQLVRLARPAHWIKNVIVLFPVVFALRMGNWDGLGTGGGGDGGLLPGRERRLHHQRHSGPAQRPPAPAQEGPPAGLSGQVSVRAAGVLSAVLLVAAAAVAWPLGPITLDRRAVATCGSRRRTRFT